MITYKEIADSLIDNYCELFGIRNCICYLMDIGVKKKGLLKMGFDLEDIEAAENEVDND